MASIRRSVGMYRVAADKNVRRSGLNRYRTGALAPVARWAVFGNERTASNSEQKNKRPQKNAMPGTEPVRVG